MRRKRILKVLGVILLLLLPTAFFGAHYAVGMLDRSAPPEPEMIAGTGAAYGYVTAAKNRLLPGVPMLGGADVTLSPGGYTTVTDRKGVYTLNDVPPGTYTLTFSKNGYEDYAVEKVRILPGQALYLDGSLFPATRGPAVAGLRLGTAMGIGRVPDRFAYNSTVYLDASGSKNASREGFRWEVFGPDGERLTDPYSGGPLTPQVSEMPKASPFSFTFVPPAAGIYTVRLYLSNRSHAAESVAEVAVTAVNAAPEAMPRLFPGPLPPQPGGSGQQPQSGGFAVSTSGQPVHLRGFALDKNTPMPEQYNPQGTGPNLYGQNNDHRQRVFSWHWRLEYRVDGGPQDVTALLQPHNGEQHVYFVPDQPGVYTAWLTVGDNDPFQPLQSEAQKVEITVLGGREEAYSADESQCLKCHDLPWHDTLHGDSALVTCQSCHGPAALHLAARGKEEKRRTITVSHDAGLCGRCHVQYNEWEKSFHSDGYAFGFLEIARPLLLNCTKCHYPQGFARTVRVMEEQNLSFKQVPVMKPMFPAGPMFFDFSLLPEPDGSSIACTACHNPHGPLTAENPYALRTGSADTLCATCHEEKWHNVLLRGTAGQTGSAYEYPDSRYPRQNPHLQTGGCVACHMDRRGEERDENGVRQVGGHTMRMRAVGDGETLGGFGPAWHNREEIRSGDVAGNVLNLAPCLSCHATDTFNVGHLQRNVFQLWLELGEKLAEKNSGLLPGFKPGDKCATCHRGGTMPFDDDPSLVLENAYTNYKLIGNDRSWGVHNPAYIRQLLLDALLSLD
jgi:predicted CXXCH cytochrome family protein